MLHNLIWKLNQKNYIKSYFCLRTIPTKIGLWSVTANINFLIITTNDPDIFDIIINKK